MVPSFYILVLPQPSYHRMLSCEILVSTKSYNGFILKIFSMHHYVRFSQIGSRMMYQIHSTNQDTYIRKCLPDTK